ncbi:Mitochondrial folate transporter/carrier-like, partial [Scleropages formosus]
MSNVSCSARADVPSPVPVPPESASSPVSMATGLERLLRLVRYENLAAGLSGGVVSTMVLHPLDLVKTRLAVSDGLDVRPRYNGMIHCMRSVWRHEGLRGLYRGVTPNVWGAGASWGLYFFFYNAIKAHAQEGRESELSASEHLVSAAQAGAMTLCLTNPIWVTKTRLVLQYNNETSKKQYKGMLDALVKIYRHEGIPGLYKFMVYEQLKRDYNKYRKKPSEAKLNAFEYISMAAFSKIFAVASTYPYQVVRARLQDQHNKYDGVIDVIGRTWRNEGLIGFYKGIVPNLLRVTPACCITFVVYEN